MEKSQHGGKRIGSGRKKVDPNLLKVPVSYKLPVWLLGWLRAQDQPSSVLIETALCKQFKLKPIIEKKA